MYKGTSYEASSAPVSPSLAVGSRVLARRGSPSDDEQGGDPPNSKRTQPDGTTYGKLPDPKRTKTGKVSRKTKHYYDINQGEQSSAKKELEKQLDLRATARRHGYQGDRNWFGDRYGQNANPGDSLPGQQPAAGDVTSGEPVPLGLGMAPPAPRLPSGAASTKVNVLETDSAGGYAGLGPSSVPGAYQDLALGPKAAEEGALAHAAPLTNTLSTYQLTNLNPLFNWNPLSVNKHPLVGPGSAQSGARAPTSPALDVTSEGARMPAERPRFRGYNSYFNRDRLPVGVRESQSAPETPPPIRIAGAEITAAEQAGVRGRFGTTSQQMRTSLLGERLNEMSMGASEARTPRTVSLEDALKGMEEKALTMAKDVSRPHKRR